MLDKKEGEFVQNSLLYQQNLSIKLQFLDSKYVWGKNIQTRSKILAAKNNKKCYKWGQTKMFPRENVANIQKILMGKNYEPDKSAKISQVKSAKF